MMISILSPLHVQAAALRALGYAMSNQLRVVQIFARSAINAPIAQVQAMQAAAALPSEVTRAFVAVRVEPRPSAIAAPIKPVAELAPAPVAELAAAPAPVAEEPAATPDAAPPVAEAAPAPAPSAEQPAAIDTSAASVVSADTAAVPEAPAKTFSQPDKAEAKPARRRKAPSKPAPMPPADPKTEG